MPGAPSRKMSVRPPKATTPVCAGRCSARLAERTVRHVSAMKQRFSGAITLLAHHPVSFPSSETKAAAITPSIRAICSKALFTAPFHVLHPQVLARPRSLEDGMAYAHIIGDQHLLEMRPEQHHVFKIFKLKRDGNVRHLPVDKARDEVATLGIGHV